MKFSIKDFLSKCDQIRRKLRIRSHLPKKSLMENFVLSAVANHKRHCFLQMKHYIPWQRLFQRYGKLNFGFFNALNKQGTILNFWRLPYLNFLIFSFVLKKLLISFIWNLSSYIRLTIFIWNMLQKRK